MAMLLQPGMQSLRMGANGERCPTPTPPGTPGTPHESCSIAPLTPSQSPRSETRSQQGPSFAVVVAIDFGTTSSGYAFSFTSDPEAIHMMRKWEGGDPGVANQKTPTSLLLTPEGTFHSFGYTARDTYHDLDPEEAREWLYFEKFKMKIHSTSDLTMKTELEAVNGKKMPALEVFAHALRFFKQHAVQELQEQCPALPERGAIRWVLTVPAIWKQPAKQFMREAAYEVGGAPHPASSGGPYGAVGVDLAFEKLLCQIFGEDFIGTFKARRPAAWVDLTIAFEARKRAAAPSRCSPLNISLPFSFIDFYRKHRGHNVETALRKSNVNFVKWSSQGMLRMSPEAMNELFQPTITHIIQHIDSLLKKPEVEGVKFLFLVGGFAESPVLQRAVQAAFGARCRVIVPQDVGLTILKGAVLFGLDPGVVRVRRSPLTYGVGVLNKFVEGKHPREKLLVKEGRNWCTDVFEKFVSVDQSVALGEVVQRSYCPARPGQRRTLINIYCSARDDVRYITDPGVRHCGTISLQLDGDGGDGGDAGPARGRREIRASMQFGDTEIKVTAVDTRTARTVRATIDFLSN
ncbi:LOW QUALITY PROTEIN: heat shock 70 kDa protein 12B-like [Corapipo altera]|uniref:LOW QUALITY PROTEIN: heat shock 70 kDa protein 12B-like n=1 Tax=Corapipo altera TaxID=415028 RepID=UPI000FD6411E|nr:LOW QUALITY PROTEIN: heat shock 70 kDa protein 12B-like [Corapipo altera]